MGNIRIELDSTGIRELLKSQEMANVCEAQARKMTEATGVKYVPDVRVGRTRVNARAIGKVSEKEQKVCPKCGYSHPNCRCKV